MARENKRHRDERRFGKPDRLADLILENVGMPMYANPDEFSSWHGMAGDLRASLPDVVAINADNVANYAMGYFGAVEQWDVIPAVSMPFDRFWVEALGPWGKNLPGNAAFGAMVDTLDRSRVAECFGALPTPVKSAYADDLLVRTARFVHVMLALRLIGSDYPVYPILEAISFVGPDGRLLNVPLMTRVFPVADDSGYDDIMLAHSIIMLNIVLLTMVFMNCKNVTTRVIDPDRRLNRLRREHDRAEFLRYHVIDIEPMRKVIRTEGQVESQGFKKALHICRGHFATYTPERPLFGRVAGTFWVSSHVRGTVERGVVVSDYDVKAPVG